MLADLDLNSYRIINAGSPVNSNDLATKNYVDTNVGDAVSSAVSAAASADAAAISADSAAVDAATASDAASFASASESAAQDQADYAEEWAQSSSAVSVAAGGDGSTTFSAKYWAENAASTVTGQLIYRGAWDASTGAYPTLPLVGDYYRVSSAGAVGAVNYNTGDNIIYNGTSWDKIDNTESVQDELADADNDTRVRVEATADSDTILFTAGGVNIAGITSTGVGAGLTVPTAPLQARATSDVGGSIIARFSSEWDRHLDILQPSTVDSTGGDGGEFIIATNNSLDIAIDNNKCFGFGSISRYANFGSKGHDAVAQVTVGGDGTLAIKERASVPTNVDTYGQLYVNSTDSSLRYVDGAGSEVSLVTPPERLATAWGTCNAITQVVNDGYNVSSIVNTGTGNGTINFTTEMASTNYSVNINGVGVENYGTASRYQIQVKQKSTTGFTYVSSENNSATDPFRDFVRVDFVVYGGV
jgi:hypothetical protein